MVAMTVEVKVALKVRQMAVKTDSSLADAMVASMVVMMVEQLALKWAEHWEKMMADQKAVLKVDCLVILWVAWLVDL